MNFSLFVLEILFIVTVIALVPARSELRLRRARVFHNERDRKILRASSGAGDSCCGFVK
jgi:hypothetical protein